jgi:hypothetical protein
VSFQYILGSKSEQLTARGAPVVNGAKNGANAGRSTMGDADDQGAAMATGAAIGDSDTVGTGITGTKPIGGDDTGNAMMSLSLTSS